MLYWGKLQELYDKEALSGRRNDQPAAQWELEGTGEPERAALIAYCQEPARGTGLDP